MSRARLWLRWSRRDLRARWLLVLTIALVIGIGTGMFTGLGSLETWRTRSNDESYARLNAHDVRVTLAEGSYARAGQLRLVTTAKDAARLRNGVASADFLKGLDVLQIETAFDLDHAPERIIEETLAAFRHRRNGG